MTILFIHGAWVTPACWQPFRSVFEAQGHACVAPAWPYVGKNPDPRLAEVTIRDLVDHYECEVKKLAEPPVLIGHSFGGLIVQLLLDRGLGAAGVAIDAGPPSGVLPSFTALRSALPVLLAWQGWKKLHTMSFENFAATFANTLPASEMRHTYDTQIVQAPGRIYFQAAAGIGNSLDFANSSRPPLLLITGEKDRTSTPSMVRAMYKKHQRSPRSVEMLEFPGRSHWIIAEPGYEEVANAALSWAERNT